MDPFKADSVAYQLNDAILKGAGQRAVRVFYRFCPEVYYRVSFLFHIIELV
jgi:hypothetical protein